MLSLTNDSILDILHLVEPYDLYQICQTNRDINRLCYQDKQLSFKIDKLNKKIIFVDEFLPTDGETLRFKNIDLNLILPR